jgi:hypothetical protein
MFVRGLPRQSATTPGIDFDFGKEPADNFTRLGRKAEVQVARRTYPLYRTFVRVQIV